MTKRDLPKLIWGKGGPALIAPPLKRDRLKRERRGHPRGDRGERRPQGGVAEAGRAVQSGGAGMSEWSEFPPEELERRRAASIEAMAARDREAFARKYQEHCDRDYWRYGPRCSGCDHWQSDMGNAGFCTAAGIVSGEDVIRSIGASFCSYTPPPGFPITKADHYCGLFRDDFDWSSLDQEYLERIGAMKNGELRNKPTVRPGARFGLEGRG